MTVFATEPLSVLAIKGQGVYQSFKDTPEYYLGKKFDESLVLDKRENIVERFKENREELLNSIDEKDQYYINGLLEELFPLIGGSLYGPGGGDYDRSGRVASEKRLYIAMHNQVPAGSASGLEVLSFIEGKIDRLRYLEKAIQEDFIERFFELLRQNLEKIDPNNIFDILSAVYLALLDSEYLKRYEESVHGFFMFEPFRNIVWLTTELIELSEDKENILCALISEPRFIGVTSEIIRRLMVQKGDIQTDNPKYKDSQWLSDTSYRKIIDDWLDLVILELEDGSFVNSIHASHVYYVLYRVSTSKVKELLTNWLIEEGGIEKIAKLIGRCGSDSVKGPYAHLSEEKFSETIEFSELKRVAELELKNADKDLPKYLKAVYLSIVTGKKYYLQDASEGDSF